MQVFNSTDEIFKAIDTCKNKAEADLAIKALIALAVHDKKIDKADFPLDRLSGQVLMSAMMLVIKKM